MVKRATPAKPTPRVKTAPKAKRTAGKPVPKVREPRKPAARTRKPVTPRMPAREVGAVEAAVGRDIRDLAKRDQKLAKSGLAASAIALAREIDIPKNSATSKSMCARALAETLERLRALAPPAEEADGIDDLASRRTKRIAS